VALGAALIALAVVSPVLALVAAVYNAGLLIVAARDLALLPGRSGYLARRITPEPFSLGEPEDVTVVVEKDAGHWIMEEQAKQTMDELVKFL